MRIPQRSQLRLDYLPVSQIDLNTNCRHRIIPVLRGLQHVHSQSDWLAEILALPLFVALVLAAVIGVLVWSLSDTWSNASGDSMLLTGGDAEHGRRAFLAQGCALCHLASGEDAFPTPASAASGPEIGKPQATWLYTLPGMTGSGWQHPAMEVRISELPVFKAIGLEQRPALILGADAMRGSQVDISAGAARICMRRPATT